MDVRSVFNDALHRVGFDIAHWPRQETLSWLLRQCINHYGIRTTIDVRAHHGEFAMALRSAASFDGTMISVEPVAESFEILETNAARDPAWTVHRVAASDSDGSLDLHVYKSTVFSSVNVPTDLGRDRFPVSLADSDVETVPARRLASVWEGWRWDVGDEPVFLKVDTQGHDLAVIEGAGERLGQVPVLLTEVPVSPIYQGVPTLVDYLRVLDGYGYELAGLFTIFRRNDCPRASSSTACSSATTSGTGRGGDCIDDGHGGSATEDQRRLAGGVRSSSRHGYCRCGGCRQATGACGCGRCLCLPARRRSEIGGDTRSSGTAFGSWSASPTATSGSRLGMGPA